MNFKQFLDEAEKWLVVSRDVYQEDGFSVDVVKLENPLPDSNNKAQIWAKIYQANKMKCQKRIGSQGDAPDQLNKDAKEFLINFLKHGEKAGEHDDKHHVKLKDQWYSTPGVSSNSKALN